MIKTAASEIKARFSTVHKKHLERWERENPAPKKPEAATVLREIKAGKISVDAEQLENALNEKRDWGRVSFEDVIATPSLEKYARALNARDAARARFEEVLQDAKDAYLDRVLFDHESGFVLLRDFQRWRESEAGGGGAERQGDRLTTRSRAASPSDKLKNAGPVTPDVRES